MRVLHCSDVHITRDYRRTPWRELGWRRSVAMLEQTIGGRRSQYQHARQALRAIVDDAREQAVDHIVVTGDLTGYATDDEFRDARDALGDFATSRERCSIVPGNHDYFTPGSARSSRFERHFGHLVESDAPEYQRRGPYPFLHLKGTDVAIIGTLSAHVPPVPGMGHGRLGRAQLDALRVLRDDERLHGRAILVLVHHAPFRATGRPDSYLHGLRDAAELLDIFAGPRCAILHGHVHERFHHPPIGTRPHIISAGSSTRRGSEGYWLIDVLGGEIRDVVCRTPELPIRG
jgi:3',5'-cyclic AMP phosphodiesterase CpdA